VRKRPKKLRVKFSGSPHLEPGSCISKGNSYFFLLIPLPLWEKGKCWRLLGGVAGGWGLKAPANPRLLWGAFPVGIELVCAPDS
jgi:hypothetical protein